MVSLDIKMGTLMNAIGLKIRKQVWEKLSIKLTRLLLEYFKTV